MGAACCRVAENDESSIQQHDHHQNVISAVQISHEPTPQPVLSPTAQVSPKLLSPKQLRTSQVVAMERRLSPKHNNATPIDTACATCVQRDQTREYFDEECEGSNINNNVVGPFSSVRSELPLVESTMMVCSVNNDAWMCKENVYDILAATASPIARPSTPPPPSTMPTPLPPPPIPTALSLTKILEYHRHSTLMTTTMPPSPHMAISSNIAANSLAAAATTSAAGWECDEPLSGTTEESRDRWSPAHLEAHNSHNSLTAGAPSSFTIGIGSSDGPSSMMGKDEKATARGGGGGAFIALAHFHSTAVTPQPLTPMGGMSGGAVAPHPSNLAAPSAYDRQTSLSAFHHVVPNPLSGDPTTTTSTPPGARGAVSFSSCEPPGAAAAAMVSRFMRIEMNRTFDGSEALGSAGSFGVWSHDGAVSGQEASTTPPRVYEINLPGFAAKEDHDGSRVRRW